MPYHEDVASAAIKLVQDEVHAYEKPHYHVTEDISFDINALIRQCRKNYHGIFDNPKDKVTGREKIHPKLTQAMVENIIKNIDMDVKHFSYRSKNGRKGIPTAELLRYRTREYFKQTHFGEKLDEMIRVMCIDGTAISKSWTRTVNGKDKLVTKLVDRLNFYIDPTADSIQDAHRVTERAVMSISKLKSMDWENVDDVQSQQYLNANPASGSDQKTANEADFYETWGQIPQWIVDNNPNAADKKTEVEAQIVVSGIKSDSPKLHLIQKNTETDSQGNPIRPYEEMRYRKVQGRWDGMGVAEQIWTLEMWYALTVNARINRNTLAQLGIFTVRKTGGVSTNALTRMASNGIIRVNDHDDISQLPISEAPVSSYKDEEVINDIAQKLTSAFDVAVGDALPASTTATTSAIADRNSAKAWKIVRDQIGYWGNRWMDRKLKPYIAKTIKKGDTTYITSDIENFTQMRDRVIAYLIQEEMNRLMQEKNQFPTPQALQNAITSLEQQIAQDNAIYLKTVSKLILEDVDAEVQVTNEDLNVGVMMNNIIQLMQVDPQSINFYRDMIADLMGIPRPPKTAAVQIPEQTDPSQAPVASPITPEIDQVTASTTLEENGR